MPERRTVNNNGEDGAHTNNHEPYAWLRFVLERLTLAKTVEEIEALLPSNTHDEHLTMNLAASE